MSTSDVRNVESLERLRVGLLSLSDDWEKVLQEIRLVVHRAEDYFASRVPSYWRGQTQLAERELTEAKDYLSQKLASARASDRPSAIEAKKRVHSAQQRLNVCREKTRIARTLAVEIKQQCDEMLGPLADMTEHCETILPMAAGELKTLLQTLHDYMDSSGLTPPSDG
ncbi:hypothetical protein [Stieleria varia]|uniref:Uncharacterized protein n=1 Tax=Stieleria varia TaxID=2528005 RepID=A0A5C6AYA5_9BACT|nr:hypothetical protein [Stieleria varia]TWU04467.1 hypothetical protein Pla52n_25080 [Stieleria varia]